MLDQMMINAKSIFIYVFHNAFQFLCEGINKNRHQVLDNISNLDGNDEAYRKI